MYWLCFLAIPLVVTSEKYSYESIWLDKIFNPIDKLFLKLEESTNERNELETTFGGTLTINLVWFCYFDVVVKYGLVAFKSRWKSFHEWRFGIQYHNSFITNTNLQHSGESGLSYLGQLTLLWQFISAGCGMAICVAFMAMKEKNQKL
jgi:K+-transporting ATPase ATPase A chain